MALVIRNNIQFEIRNNSPLIGGARRLNHIPSDTLTENVSATLSLGSLGLDYCQFQMRLEIPQHMALSSDSYQSF